MTVTAVPVAVLGQMQIDTALTSFLWLIHTTIATQDDHIDDMTIAYLETDYVEHKVFM